MSIQVVEMARREGLNLTVRQLYKEQTIARLVALADGGQSARVEGVTAVQENTAASILLPVNDLGKRPPFYFFHGVFGDVSSLTHLGPLLPEDQPVYGVQAVGLQAGVEADESIEQMAARYAETIRNVQPAGPYYLGGFCFGGVVAYETARQLLVQGASVGLLVVLESSAPRPYHRARPVYDQERLRIIKHSAPCWLRGYQEFGGWRLGRRLRSVARGETRRGAASGRQAGENVEFDIFAEFNAMRPQRQFELSELHKQAAYVYRPEPIALQMTLLRARCVHIGHALLNRFDPRRGWESLAADGVRIRYVDGTHVGLLVPPYVSDTAATLTSVLHEAQLVNA